MVLAVGLSQYTLSVFHLVNHAYFKALLFLSAGAVIHSFSDEQDMRKYGGLINILPFTYISILIGSLSLLAIPFLTGFYSKDLILEVAYGQYKFQGSIGYWLGTITACITSFYSFRLIYLTFISYPNGVKYNYSHAHEPSIIMTIPLVILGLFSIFHGYFAYDLFIGLGSGLWGNSIFISPDHVSTIEGEFSIPLHIKLLPLFGSLFSIALGTYIYNNLLIIGDKGIKKVIYRFLNKRYHIDNIYNSFILSNVFNLAYITSKKLDKGVLELIGVTALVKLVNENSSKLASFDNGYIPHLALNVIIGYILVLGGVGYLPGEEIILILVLMMILSRNTKTHSSPSLIINNNRGISTIKRSYSTKPEKKNQESLWTKIKSLYNDLNNKFIKWTESPWFIIQFGVIFGVFGLISSLWDQGFFPELFSKIELSSEDSNNNNNNNPNPGIQTHLHLSGSITIDRALNYAGAGVGIAAIVAACPPQTRPAVAFGIAGIAAVTSLGLEAINNTYINNIEVNTGDTTSTSRPPSPKSDGDGGGTIMRSPLEPGIFDRLPSDLKLLGCILVILLIVIYLFIGLIMNYITRYYIDSKLINWINERPGLKIYYNWFKGGSNITMIVIIATILFGLIVSVIFIYYIFKIRGII
jgi:NADH-ubiquinone oxidoreductase chain 5